MSREVEAYPSINLLSLLYAPRKRVVEFKIHLKNAPGALLSVVKTFYKHKINIIGGYLPNTPIEPTGYWTVFADFTRSTITPEVFVKELKRRRKVIDVKYVEGENFLIDAYRFKVVTPVGRVFTLTVNGYASVVRALREAFGSAADYILFTQGVKYRETMLKAYLEAFPLSIQDE